MIKKEVVQTICIFLVLFFLVAPSQSREAAPAEVVQAAADGLDSFLKAIPLNELMHYGFSSVDELADAFLGNPFRVHTIHPDELLNFNSEKKLSSIISPTFIWFFPILSREEIRTILTVDKMNGKWEAVAIGSSGLAKQLKMIENKWPVSDDYDHTFVRIYQAKSDFVLVAKKGIIKITPLESAMISLKLEKATETAFELYNPSGVIPKMIPIVKQNIQSHEAIKH